MSEQNKALVRTLFERADKSDASVIEDVVATEYADHNPPPFQGPATGAAGAHDAFTAALKIFSDFDHEIVQQIAEGDYVVTRVIGRGRHTGDFMGIPATNNDV